MQLIQDLKIEMEVIKNTKTEGILQIENLGNQTETTEASITNRLQELREWTWGKEDMIEEIITSVNENIKSKKKKNPDTNIQKIWDTRKRANLRII